MPANELKLQSGRTYRGKRPRNAMGLVNDRTILHIGATTVQYDSPSVSFGRHYPSVSREKFLAWAERDVTEELPPGEFATWPIGSAREVEPETARCPGCGKRGESNQKDGGFYCYGSDRCCP